MAIMTTSDVLKINNSEELVGLIDEVIQEVPEMTFFQASPVTKNSYKTLVQTALPTVGFREPGSNRTFGTATLDKKEVNCRYLDASWMIESAVAEMSDWGKEFAFALEQKAHLKAAFMKLAQQIWYGDYSVDSGFDGLTKIVDAVTDSNSARIKVISANVPTSGNNISDGSSVFAVSTGLDSCQLAWGSEGKLVEGDISSQLWGADVTLSGGSIVQQGRHIWQQKLGGWVGLQVTSKHAAAKIEALSATANRNGLTDNYLAQLLDLFPAGTRPGAIFMSRRSLRQLRESRYTKSYNPLGIMGPSPNEFDGVPIYTTDAISDTESYTYSS